MDVEIQDLEVAYGQVRAVDRLSLSVRNGEMVVLLGPSGCGKTSTMRAIVGLERPSGGSISVGGQTLFDAPARIHVPTSRRRIGMVFQSYAVWPHKTVFQNIAFPLRMQHVPKAEIRDRVERAAELMELAPLLDRGASKLSGGQMQRVALARSIVMNPRVLLFDEPLSNLDARLRDKLRLDLKDLQVRLGITSIYVTHDQGEALALADRVAVMDKGKIVQIDEPVSLYKRPASLTVAEFLGTSNILPGTVGKAAGTGLVEFTIAETGLTLVSAQSALDETRDYRVCLRPEAIRMERQAPGQAARVNALTAKVAARSFLGSQMRYRAELLPGGLPLDVVSPSDQTLDLGETVLLSVDPSEVRVLPC